MHIRKLTEAAVLGASLSWMALALAAQQAAAPTPSQNSPTPTITATTQLVNLPVVVRDKNGALVATLNKEDFALAVDGRKQPIHAA